MKLACGAPIELLVALRSHMSTLAHTVACQDLSRTDGDEDGVNMTLEEQPEGYRFGIVFATFESGEGIEDRRATLRVSDEDSTLRVRGVPLHLTLVAQSQGQVSVEREVDFTPMLYADEMNDLVAFEIAALVAAFLSSGVPEDLGHWAARLLRRLEQMRADAGWNSLD